MNYNVITLPLTQLLKKDVTYTWSNIQDKSFRTIKNELTKAPTLQFYDPNKVLNLANDANEYGIGSVLSQEGKPIGFTSRNLTETERNYALLEIELLAIINGLRNFTIILTEEQHK